MICWFCVLFFILIHMYVVSIIFLSSWNLIFTPVETTCLFHMTWFKFFIFRIILIIIIRILREIRLSSIASEFSRRFRYFLFCSILIEWRLESWITFKLILVVVFMSRILRRLKPICVRASSSLMSVCLGGRTLRSFRIHFNLFLLPFHLGSVD